MSHPAICSGVADVPNPNVPVAGIAGSPDLDPALAALQIEGNVASATHSTAAVTSRPRSRSEDLHIGHLPGRVHAPCLDRIVVIDRARAAHRSQLTDRGLHVASV